jgi:hypothetical protein
MRCASAAKANQHPHRDLPREDLLPMKKRDAAQKSSTSPPSRAIQEKGLNENVQRPLDWALQKAHSRATNNKIKKEI